MPGTSVANGAVEGLRVPERPDRSAQRQQAARGHHDVAEVEQPRRPEPEIRGVGGGPPRPMDPVTPLSVTADSTFALRVSEKLRLIFFYVTCWDDSDKLAENLKIKKYRKCRKEGQWPPLAMDSRHQNHLNTDVCLIVTKGKKTLKKSAKSGQKRAKIWPKLSEMVKKMPTVAKAPNNGQQCQQLLKIKKMAKYGEFGQNCQNWTQVAQNVHFFCRPPPPGCRQTLLFWLVGDGGR